MNLSRLLGFFYGTGFQQAEVFKVGDGVKAVKDGDIIYFDKSSSHRIEINKEPYHVIRQENVVVVL